MGKLLVTTLVYPQRGENYIGQGVNPVIYKRNLVRQPQRGGIITVAPMGL